MARFFSADMFLAIAAGIMAFTAICSGIALLFVGVIVDERVMGVWLLAVGLVLVYLATILAVE